MRMHRVPSFLRKIPGESLSDTRRKEILDALLRMIREGRGIGGPGICRGRWLNGPIAARLRTMSLAQKTGVSEEELEMFRATITEEESAAVKRGTENKKRESQN